jgi:succinate dehydrogenase / fumarate reductase, cytochrome b subunit
MARIATAPPGGRADRACRGRLAPSDRCAGWHADPETIVHRPDRSWRSALHNALPSQLLDGGYRYFTGSLAYVLHRVSGLALLFFVFFHILSITKAQATPEDYDLLIRRMQEPDFKVGEILLYAGLLYHGLNGIRIVVVDFAWTRTTHHKRLWWGFAILTAALLIAGSIPLLLHSNVQPLLGVDGLPGGR